MHSVDLIARLDGGLTMRRASANDAVALVNFHADIHREGEDAGPNPYIASWMRDLLSGQHPTVQASDFTIVETEAGEMVSSLCLISQTWSFSGVPFGVGRIELVSTHRDYRRRGLVRRQMDVVHQWSADRGELVQGITGIPYFYRQFGYEMAVDLGAGRAGSRDMVPALGQDETEPFTVRPATVADLPLIAELDDLGRQRWLLTSVRDEIFWRYELERPREENFRVAWRIISDADERPIGYFAHLREMHDGRLFVVAYELLAGISWLAVTPSVMRAVLAAGDSYTNDGDSGTMKSVSFNFGTDHPAYQVLPERHIHSNRPYAWYLRVADLPAFLDHVGSVLEDRLRASVACGHTGELLINLYASGLRLALTGGKVTAIELWNPPDPDSGNATFPGLTLLQLVFGYRSLAELEHAFPDCRTTSDESRVLLNALFPKTPSRVWPIE